MEQRWTHAEALNLAYRIAGYLNPFTERIEIAGSLRRCKPTVGDIEILYIPKWETRQSSDDMFASIRINLVDDILNGWLNTGKFAKRQNTRSIFTWGEKNKLAVHCKTRVPVDFFATTEENWWVSLVIRTGSKETNLALTTGAQQRGLKLNAYGCGVTNLKTGEITPANSEQHVFELCGVPYREPKDR